MVNSSGTRLEALITILDYSLVDTLISSFKKINLPIFLLTHGYGSARSAIYDIIGFGSPKKVVSLSIQTESMTGQAIRQLNNEINFSKPGTGVACSVSLSSVSKTLLMTCEKANENFKMGSENMRISNENYHLIIAIVNNGHFEPVMEAAKAAGATGGTLVHARGLGSPEAIKYLGITIEPEKDLVLIIAPENKKNAIMESITHKVGLNTAGMGICFSLPVNDAVGFDTKIEDIKEGE